MTLIEQTKAELLAAEADYQDALMRKEALRESLLAINRKLSEAWSQAERNPVIVYPKGWQPTPIPAGFEDACKAEMARIDGERSILQVEIEAKYDIAQRAKKFYRDSFFTDRGLAPPVDEVPETPTRIELEVNVSDVLRKVIEKTLANALRPGGKL